MRIEGKGTINHDSGTAILRGVFKVNKQGSLVYIQYVEEPERLKDKWEGRFVPTNRFNYLDPNEEVDLPDDIP